LNCQLTLERKFARYIEVRNNAPLSPPGLTPFVGLLQDQAAKELNLSLSTAERLWAYARAWLFRALRQGLPLTASSWLKILEGNCGAKSH
jgi:ECF sigma factor